MSLIRLPDGTPVSMGDVCHWLRTSLHRGTPRPHRTQPGMSPERRATLDAQAHLERLERTDVALAEHPAPYDLDAAELLDQAPAAAQDLDLYEKWVARALSHLGLLVTGQTLDALCPWCDGRTDGHPLGGGKTLRVRMLRDGRAAIACQGDNCQPGPDVGEDWRGHPAWPLVTEGEWLAGRIEHADMARALAAGVVASMVTVETAAAVCWCGQPPVPGEAGCCSTAHRKTAERRSQRARRAVA